MLTIEKYSIGIGDRFGKQGLAQLRAVQQAEKAGAVVVPVWNKSNREHMLIGTKPDDVRAEADDAVVPPRPVQLVWKNWPRGWSTRSYWCAPK